MVSVVWPDTVANKHLVVLPAKGMTFDELVKEGMRVYNERASGKKKDVYGKTAPSAEHGNTLIITFPAGLEEINAWIKQNGKHGGKASQNNVPVKSGAIVTGLDTSEKSKVSYSGGTVHFQMKKEGDTITVEHLSGQDVTGQQVLTGPEVTERQTILKSHLGGDMPLTGHFKSSTDILRMIDTFSLGSK
jgi:hypothetical protein